MSSTSSRPASDAHDPQRILARARLWIQGDPDAQTRAELERLLDDGEIDVLAERVAGALHFGTAGLRAEVGAGPLRMNRAVVIRTTRGLADHLHADGRGDRPVVVGFDARVDSRRFATDAVAVLRAAGFDVRTFTEPMPTPLVAYAAKALGAGAAIVVTASHNPPSDNGYKVYGGDAIQIVPPEDGAIAAAIAAVGLANEVPRDEAELDDLPAEQRLDEGMTRRYLGELASSRAGRGAGDQALTIAYTPLHGVGWELVQRALGQAGYEHVHVVPEQAEPDGRFPTVAFPNPEEPGALDLVLALADRVGADLVLANDPDVDRLAVAIPDGEGGWRRLHGNEIGLLLADDLLGAGGHDRPLVVSSIVSTPAIDALAAGHGASSERTLTGFKWICTAARALATDDGHTFVMGFEEALGTTVGEVVHDKDGIGAAVAFADLASRARAEGRSVLDRLDDLWRRLGVWVSHQHNIVRPGLQGRAEIDAAMERLAGERPAVLAGHPVTDVTDLRVGAGQRPRWLPADDVVLLGLGDTGRVVIRPSGTEPKLKIYVDLRAEVAGDAPTAGLRATERRLLEEAAAVAEATASWLELDG